MIQLKDAPEELMPREHSKDCAYLELSGEQGIFRPEQLKKGYERFIESPYKSIIIDFRRAYPKDGAPSYDTSIPAHMIEFLKTARERKGNLGIILEPSKRKVFHLSRLEECFDFLEEF